ncbi:large conductance mechanosensitive channel protein MscL [Polynucleobacter paneuropaeus]|jgi:large conductance mechanosensitive channel|nr:large conductance mechanosensitive channel protein MscL [Polynucleobacter paneuropaeus]MBT8616782.1 large conductance mechanosensitive channel protein MscL [Polynucleobacter paneuropaeus]MBT8618662.1 large conductance mechanosensitive channel protein MscL [Polynucleobacter paneuropaeus]MBT8620945.1 large conductance mechanosensitive channel protein MscL [Polynucleobacter paneuropaeus]MBT8626079.1 large conductance mechanosensitive channel protein MscL [Polynucleobacter paneuropaeus]
MGVLKEFRDFAVKGSVIDLAVGVIIGGAFGKIVDSLVNDIVMPVISTLLGGHIDFTNLFIVLGSVPDNVPRTYDTLKKAGVPIFAYGNFITISINFILLAFVIFQMVKVVNKIRVADAPPPPPTPEDIVLLREIRDSLKK